MFEACAEIAKLIHCDDLVFAPDHRDVFNINELGRFAVNELTANIKHDIDTSYFKAEFQINYELFAQFPKTYYTKKSMEYILFNIHKGGGVVTGMEFDSEKIYKNLHGKELLSDSHQLLKINFSTVEILEVEDCDICLTVKSC